MIYLLVESLILGSGLWWLLSRLRPARYPPGPFPLPLIGNVFDIPQSCPWEKIKSWRELFGDLIYVKIFKDRTLFINSYDLAVELLDRRASIYSSRPRFVMSNELQGWGYLLPLMPSCKDHKRKRQIALRLLQPSAIGRYNPILTKEVHKMLLGILNNPEKFETCIRHLSGATIMMIAYGYEVRPENDPYIEMAEKAIVTLTESTTFLVNYFPILKFFPDWLPGAEFKRHAKDGHKLATDVLNLPFATGKEQIMTGSAFPSIMSEMFKENVDKGGETDDEELMKAITSVMYIAGSDSTVSSNLSFVLAMVLYPEVQKRGQEEIDRVVRKGNLPTMDDLSSLPYVNAIYYELLRWHPVTPFSLPHCTVVDDTYHGYLIPAETTVIANVWAMTREYPEPELFKPERFLEKGATTLPMNPELYTFGFGRRKCPGSHLAENLASDAIKLAIASFLAVCNIEKALGEDGLPITPSEDYSSTAISHPKPFKCWITPRLPEFMTLLTRFVEAGE